MEFFCIIIYTGVLWQTPSHNTLGYLLMTYRPSKFHGWETAYPFFDMKLGSEAMGTSYWKSINTALYRE